MRRKICLGAIVSMKSHILLMQVELNKWIYKDLVLYCVGVITNKRLF